MVQNYIAREESVNGSGVILILSQPFLDEPEGPLSSAHVRHDSLLPLHRIP